MRRPPVQPVVFSRPAYEWINRINQRYEELSGLQLSAGLKEKLDRWVEVEFVHSTLARDGADLSRARVAALVSSPDEMKNSTGPERPIVELLESLRIIEGLAKSQGREALITPALLLRLRWPLESASGRFRESPGDTKRILKPVLPGHLPASLESACRWFNMESFLELNPVEQASIAHLRLNEIQPFEDGNERSTLVAASLFTMRAGLPPVIIGPGRGAPYRAALEEGLRMNTQPMVETMASAIEATLGEMIEAASKMR